MAELLQLGHQRKNSCKSTSLNVMRKKYVSVCRDACVCTRVRVHGHTHTWERARMKTIYHRQEKENPHQDLGATVWRDHNTPGGWKIRSHSSALTFTCLIWKKSFQLTLLFSDWSSRRIAEPVWDFNDKATWKCFVNTCTNIHGHYCPFVPVLRRATFVGANVPTKGNLFRSQAAFSNGRRDVDNFPERQCFFISLLVRKQKSKIFLPPFCFSK